MNLRNLLRRIILENETPKKTLQTDAELLFAIIVERLGVDVVRISRADIFRAWDRKLQLFRRDYGYAGDFGTGSMDGIEFEVRGEDLYEFDETIDSKLSPQERDSIIQRRERDAVVNHLKTHADGYRHAGYIDLARCLERKADQISRGEHREP